MNSLIDAGYLCWQRVLQQEQQQQNGVENEYVTKETYNVCILVLIFIVAVMLKKIVHNSDFCFYITNKYKSYSNKIRYMNTQQENGGTGRPIIEYENP